MNISYSNKSQTIPYDASKWNAQDANEVKNAINSKEDLIQGQQTNHGFQVGEGVYRDNTGWHRSINTNNSITSRVDGVVVAIVDVSNFVVGKKGAHFIVSALTVDTDYYLGNSSPNYTTVEPTTIGNIRQVLFTTSSTTEAVVVLSEPLEIIAQGTTIPGNDSITNAMLGTDIKIGSLSALNTNTQGSIVAAINELMASVLGLSGGSGSTDKNYISLPALSSPGSFSAAPASDTQIDLSWADVSGEENYLLQRSTLQTSGYSTVSTPVAGSTSYSDSGLVGNTTYYYRLKSVGNGGNTRDSVFVFTSASTNAVSGGGSSVEQEIAMHFVNPFNSIDYTGWNRLNNLSGSVEAGTASFSSLVDITGATTSIGFQLTSVGLGDTGAPSGSGEDPDNNTVFGKQWVPAFAWKFSNGNTFKITGLVPSRTYKVYFWANSFGWESNTVTFTANGVTTTQVITANNVGDNTGDPLLDAALREVDIVSNASGEILVTANLISGGYVPLNALYLQRIAAS